MTARRPRAALTGEVVPFADREGRWGATAQVEGEWALSIATVYQTPTDACLAMLAAARKAGRLVILPGVRPMTDEGMIGTVVCVRIADRPVPETPSDRVLCQRCLEPCWLSQMARGGAFDVVCLACFMAAVGPDVDVTLAPWVRADLARRRSN